MQSVLPLDRTQSSPVSVSADGSVIVSTSYSDGRYGPPYVQAFILGKPGLGGGIYIGTLPYLDSRAYGVSADGSVVVGALQLLGAFQNTFDSSGKIAALWTQTGSGASIRLILGTALQSFASSVSADGTVVVGQSGNEAFIWNNTQGMQGLGLLPGSSSSYASDVSADGTVVVGQSGGEAFIWNNAQGMQSLASVLTAAGINNLTGWELASATAVSADGFTVVGYGTNPSGQTEAWIADLRNPTAVPTPALLPGLMAMGVAAWRKRNAGAEVAEED